MFIIDPSLRKPSMRSTTATEVYKIPSQPISPWRCRFDLDCSSIPGMLSSLTSSALSLGLPNGCFSLSSATRALLSLALIKLVQNVGFLLSCYWPSPVHHSKSIAPRMLQDNWKRFSWNFWESFHWYPACKSIQKYLLFKNFWTCCRYCFVYRKWENISPNSRTASSTCTPAKW